MTHRPVSLHAARGTVGAEEIRAGIDALLADAGELPVDFPAHVLAQAEAAAALPLADPSRADRTDIPFITLDPASSTDLDQAMHLERTGDGFTVRYAIADVPHFVGLDTALDAEARRRGSTVYLPDRRIPLHPQVLSEGAASLLPDQDAPAFIWTLALDARGEVTEIGLERARVRSVEKLAYDQVQDELDAGTASEMMRLLMEIGELREQLEAERGGASLNVPEQEVDSDDAGNLRLEWRQPAPVEAANAQISLMTGMAAASLMLEHGAGILRTMPPAEPGAIARFRRQTQVLGTPWPHDVAYGSYLRSLDWRDSRHLALLNLAASLFRGASYAAFTTADEAPEDPAQAAIAAPYSHTTAPLRRLVDRFVLLLCHAHAQGERPDPALLVAIGEIPEIMRRTAGRAGDLERRAREVVETAALQQHVGEEFEASVIDRREASPVNGNGKNGADGNGTQSANGNGSGKNGADGSGRGEKPPSSAKPTRVEIQLVDPPLTAWVHVDAPLGARLRVRLAAVDPVSRKRDFEVLEISEPDPGARRNGQS